MKEVFNRFESKYLISSELFEEILPIIQEHMVLDQFNENIDFYPIYNIYFDSVNHDLIRHSLDKPVYKEKIRIRSYQYPVKLEQLVFLEIKKKFQKFTNKRRSKMTFMEALHFLNTGEIELQDYMNPQIVEELREIILRQPLLPDNVISYERRAFHSKDQGGLRISFDKNITYKKYDSLEDPTPLLSENQILMEIKTPTAMPFWLVDLINQKHIVRQSFSKAGKSYLEQLKQIEKEYQEFQEQLNLSTKSEKEYNYV